MANELQTKLNAILEEKQTKILPKNIKTGTTIFNVVGNITGGNMLYLENSSSLLLLYPALGYNTLDEALNAKGYAITADYARYRKESQALLIALLLVPSESCQIPKDTELTMKFDLVNAEGTVLASATKTATTVVSPQYSSVNIQFLDLPLETILQSYNIEVTITGY